MQISNYTDALYYMTPKTRYNEATRILVTEKLVQPGTPEYIELSRMRLQARKEMMGFSSRPSIYSPSLEEFYSDERAAYTNEREYYERD